MSVVARYRVGDNAVAKGRQPISGATLGYDWSDTNLPWAYTSTDAWESRMPSGVPVVDIQTGSNDFYTNLQNTVNAQPGRCIVRLREAVYTLNSFRMIGASGDPTYSFGFWFPKLAGFTGRGADKTFVEMAANSMTQAQLDRIGTMTQASFDPNQMGLCRIDGSDANPIFLGGLTFRANRQQNVTMLAPDLKYIVLPQSAPHLGVVIYSGSAGVVSHARFQGAGKAMNSQPPFESANVASQRSKLVYYNTESDGRISAAFDPARPRQCGVWMGNNEVDSRLVDSWLHHSNLSRYAANDENRETAALSTTYSLLRCKLNQITNTKNDGLGGYTNATPLGWESTNAQINVTDCIVEQDNPFTDRQTAQLLQLTSVGSRDPQGGRMTVTNMTARNNAWPQLNGIVSVRATDSFWTRDGIGNTVTVRKYAGGPSLTPYIYNGPWPITAAQLAAAGVTPDTHFLVRN